MDKKRVSAIIVFGIFALAAALRIYPAILNHDANDNHIKVIRIIAQEGRIPGKDEPECLQCYHPKFYHYVTAKTIGAIPIDFKNKTWIIGQLISTVAGILTLVYVFFFLRSIAVSETARILAFLLAALNPALIGINIQVTNDSFVILFSTAALYHLFRFLREDRLPQFLAMTAAVILAALSKGSGLVILLGITIVLLTRTATAYGDAGRLKRYAFLSAALLGVSLPTILALTPYDEYFGQYGSPLSINKEMSPPPDFFRKTYVGSKTGIVSIYDAYFTFRPLDLIREPYLDRDRAEGDYQPARESLWTQFYARANFIQYERHPELWITKLKSRAYDLGKVIYVVALVPLVILLLGIFLTTKRGVTLTLKDPVAFLGRKSAWIFPFFLFMFLASIVKFTLDYREFSSMKPIYVFPALLAFVYVFAKGLDFVLRKTGKPLFRKALILSLLFLAGLYVVDIAYLIKKLL